MKNIAKNQQKRQSIWKSPSIGTRTTIIAFLTAGALVLPAGAAMAKEPVRNSQGPSVHIISQPMRQKHPPIWGAYQGIIIQVDTSNSNNINFTLMNSQGSTQTIYLTSNTRFAKNQSATLLTLNTFVMVNTVTDSTGLVDAQQITLQKQGDTSFNLTGIVASTYLSQNQLNLALNDGTVLTITVKNPALAQLHKGMSISLKAHRNANGAFEAANFSISQIQSQQFTVQGSISSWNTQTQQLVLTSSSGASFSVSMSDAMTLQTGEKVAVSGTIDSNDNFVEQNVTVKNINQSPIEMEGMVSAIDTNANTFSFVDEEGNSFLFSVDPMLFANLTVGNVYTVTASMASGGSLQASQVASSPGSNRGKEIELKGRILTYDPTSGLLTLAGTRNQSFSIQVSSQTIVEGKTSSSTTLAVGEKVEIRTRLNTIGSYSASHIKIQRSAPGQSNNS